MKWPRKSAVRTRFRNTSTLIRAYLNPSSDIFNCILKLICPKPLIEDEDARKDLVHDGIVLRPVCLQKTRSAPRPDSGGPHRLSDPPHGTDVSGLEGHDL
jgi:hypothetical protein